MDLQKKDQKSKQAYEMADKAYRTGRSIFIWGTLAALVLITLTTVILTLSTNLLLGGFAVPVIAVSLLFFTAAAIIFLSLKLHQHLKSREFDRTHYEYAANAQTLEGAQRNLMQSTRQWEENPEKIAQMKEEISKLKASIPVLETHSKQAETLFALTQSEHKACQSEEELKLEAFKNKAIEPVHSLGQLLLKHSVLSTAKDSLEDTVQKNTIGL